MAEASTIARPYAQGVFELAQANKQLAAWSELLEAAATVARDQTMKVLLGNPQVAREQLASLFIELCGDTAGEAGKNLLRLLAENRRLGLLPEIASQYGKLRAEAENTVQARLIAAQPVDEAVRARIAEALGKRLNRKVDLTTETDESLLGGAVIRAGDLVIDGSVRGRLESLAGSLSR